MTAAILFDHYPGLQLKMHTLHAFPCVFKTYFKVINLKHPLKYQLPEIESYLFIRTLNAHKMETLFSLNFNIRNIYLSDHLTDPLYSENV